MLQKLNLNKDQLYALSMQLSQDKSIALASNIFAKQIEQVQKEFAELMQKSFGFMPEKLQSVQQVNSWCAQHTNQKIKSIVDSVDFDAILLSAIHFKADWLIQFNNKLTKEKDFKAFDGTVKKQMMHIQTDLYYSETNTAQLCMLNYKDSKLKAVIILPKQDSKEAFNQALNEQNIENKQFRKQKLTLELPKFTIESSLQLKDLLKQLGVTKIFEHIDTSKTLGTPMHVSQIIQKTFIQVDEKGTEAAAVTAVKMLTSASRKQEQETQMICDRPFWFLLVG